MSTDSPAPPPPTRTTAAQRLVLDTDDDPAGPLWRAAQVFRLVSVVYALGFQIAVNGDLDRPGLTWVLFGVLAGWSLAAGIAFFAGFGRNWYWVTFEILIACLLMLSTSIVASESWALNNQSWPTTLWATNAAISAAVLGGPLAGVIAGLVVGGTSTFVKGELDLNFGRNATIVVIVATGMAIGLAARTAARAQAKLAQAARIAAATEERERLSREVHDGVLQVLALIAKRGKEIGGQTAELATMAAEQERLLRKLISSAAVDIGTDAGTTDVAAALRDLGTARVAVSAPAQPVLVSTPLATGILGAVLNALENVDHHAGAGANAFVLLEDLDHEIVVSIRDDGVGIAAGRLAQAQSDGRLGVAQSIVGRIESLGGRAVVDSEPGAGTEWELTIPRSGRGER